jgi:hypothetical protein
LNKVLNSYDFDELRQQIENKEKWNKEAFTVFSYEAGSGKSRESQRFLGEMTKNYSYKAVYIQRFVKDNRLEETVNRINEFAGRDVAVGITGEDNKKKNGLDKAKGAQIIVCSHSMYKQFCRGLHTELLKEREILVVDEYIDLVERIYLTLEDMASLWSDFDLYEQGREMVALAEIFKERYYHYSTLLNAVNKQEIFYLDFQDTIYAKYKRAVESLITSVHDKVQKQLLIKIQNLLKNGGLFYENCFHTFEDISFYLLENNIILDANGNFDATYQLHQDIFHVKNQPHVFDYYQIILKHFNINTSKGQLEKYLNFYEKMLEEIEFNKGNKILFVTEKDSVRTVQEALLIKYGHIGDTIEEIESHFDIKFEIEYFGNIIGRNDFRDFDKVVILKTPNYSYLDYALKSFYLRTKSGKPMGSIRIFENQDIESIRKTAVAAEIYQAIRRINRDMKKNAQIYLFCDSTEEVDIVRQQLKNVQYVKQEVLFVEKGENGKKEGESKLVEKINRVQDALLEYVHSNIDSIRKKDIRSQASIADKSEFSKILKYLEPFLTTYHIESKGQKFILIHDTESKDVS